MGARIIATLLLSGLVLAQYPPETRKEKAQEANKSAKAAQNALNQVNLPAGLTLDKLAAMKPEELDMILSKLPPVRQAGIKQRVQNYAALPAEQKARIQKQLDRLHALPEDRRAQVRLALVEYLRIPMPRRAVIAVELGKIDEMPDERRSVYMSRPGFRSRYSQPEIDLMNALRGIVP